ncbi:hypothetical protein C7S16_0988 [Burkholderia thailandensis]|uniref:Uncharacterized protein n=1 Tax=Burkholderia thailandensis TaxID=57975 RepID=A0AAW9D2E6_BURTH|nr:hypothetical protein [Burkholderia thailandensis]
MTHVASRGCAAARRPLASGARRPMRRTPSTMLTAHRSSLFPRSAPGDEK